MNPKHPARPGTLEAAQAHSAADPFEPAGQPVLTSLVSCLHSGCNALSDDDGQLDGTGILGLYRDDLRLLHTLEVLVDGQRPLAFHHASPQPHWAAFALVPAAPVAISSGPAPGTDYPLWLTRTRTLDPDGMTEEIEARSGVMATQRFTLEVRAATDLAGMGLARQGGHDPGLEPGRTGSGLRWQRGEAACELSASPAPQDVDGGCLRWRVTLGPQAVWRLTLRLTAKTPRPGRASRRTPEPDGAGGPGAGAEAGDAMGRPELISEDVRLTRLWHSSLADLRALARRDAEHPEDAYLAAGHPWYLTLFGRDSLISALLTLPLGTEMALGTLRALARRQGRKHDSRTAEEPGKILHELRSRFARGYLPLRYYGTVDATPLWLITLREAWAWGAPEAQIAALLDPAARALEWLADPGHRDAHGFLTYLDEAGHGLRNQGWKDSPDAIHDRAGNLAAGPVALVEVQGYAYRAALAGAELLDAFGRPGAARWREYAAGLQARFRSRFWAGGRPALALGADGRTYDAPASNIGHLLGTGILNAAESGQVAAALTAPSMASPFGLRTLDASSPRYHPLSYHNGSIWPHDTALAIGGLRASGQDDGAKQLIAALLAAAPAFGYRLPELWAGEAAYPGAPGPLPYPSACAPQAWAAASGVSLLTAIVGLRPRVPEGVIEIAPLHPSPAGALRAQGLPVAGGRLDLAIDAGGTVTQAEFDGPVALSLICS